MKQCYFILAWVTLLSLFGACTSEAEGADNQVRDCAWGEKEAAADLAKDSMLLIRYGFPMPESDFMYQVYAEDYGIYTKLELGCSIEGWEECYNDVMYEAIEDKYGADLYIKVETKANQLYEAAYGVGAETDSSK